MFVYEKKLQYPVKIKNTNPALAKFIISQYGGADGELHFSLLDGCGGVIRGQARAVLPHFKPAKYCKLRCWALAVGTLVSLADCGMRQCHIGIFAAREAAKGHKYPIWAAGIDAGSLDG